MGDELEWGLGAFGGVGAGVGVAIVGAAEGAHQFVFAFVDAHGEVASAANAQNAVFGLLFAVHHFCCRSGDIALVGSIEHHHILVGSHASGELNFGGCGVLGFLHISS